MDLKAEIEQTRKACGALEQLIDSRQPLALDERKALLVAHWTLLVDLHMSITSLILQNLCGGAFGLMRPLTEAWLRAHLVVSGDDKVYQSIKDDSYRTNFVEVPKEIDEFFGLEFFGKNLSPAVVSALHSFTHSGGMQNRTPLQGPDLRALVLGRGEVEAGLHLHASAGHDHDTRHQGLGLRRGVCRRDRDLARAHEEAAMRRHSGAISRRGSRPTRTNGA